MEVIFININNYFVLCVCIYGFYLSSQALSVGFGWFYLSAFTVISALEGAPDYKVHCECHFQTFSAFKA